MDFAMPLHPEAVAAGTLETADGRPVAGAVLRFHPFRMGSSNPESDNNWNILAFSLPSDPAWDTECWNKLFLTDCEATTSETGEFKAPSLTPGIHYVVEVNGERLSMSTTKKNPEPLRLRLSR